MKYETAHDVLKAHWDGKLPVDPVVIAQRMGIEVQPSSPFSSESGHYLYRDGSPLITYHPTDAPVRRRFTIAHEVGHHVHGDVDAPRDTAESFNSMSRDPREVAANRFAAALLMPKSVVNFFVLEKGVTDLSELAGKFGVSMAAMKFRLKNIGLI